MVFFLRITTNEIELPMFVFLRQNISGNCRLDYSRYSGNIQSRREGRAVGQLIRGRRTPRPREIGISVGRVPSVIRRTTQTIGDAGTRYPRQPAVRQPRGATFTHNLGLYRGDISAKVDSSMRLHLRARGLRLLIQ